MSFLARVSLRAVAKQASAIYQRPFSSTSIRAALSESDQGRDDASRKATIDEHKHDQINKQKQGENEWKKELSSNSESAVKADREEITDAKHDIENLQKKTASAMEEDHDHGKK